MNLRKPTATTRLSWLDEIIDRLGLLYTVVLDVQFHLGLILYMFLSPLTQAAFANLAAALADRTLRFFAVEHVTGMLVAIVLAHVGRAITRRALVCGQPDRDPGLHPLGPAA